MLHFIKCGVLFKVLRKSARPHAAVHHPRHIRHIRRARRAVAIVCVSVGGFGSAALIPPLVYAPPVQTIERAAGHIDLAARAPQPIPEPPSLALLLPAAVVAIAIAGRRRHG